MTTETPADRDYFNTVRRSLDRGSPPMRLWEKAKSLGVWNPSAIDLTRDRADWEGLAPEERDLLLRILVQFQAGEEAVTVDLLPLVETVASEGRIEEEMYLTSFLWEEAKHVDFFRRYLDEVAAGAGDQTPNMPGGSYDRIFNEALPRAMQRLRTDKSREAQAAAATVYNMVVEGVMAETGYHVYYEIMEKRGVLPGLREGVGLIQRDEARHIAFGVYFLSRLVSEDPAMLDVIRTRMLELQPHAMGTVSEFFGTYPDGIIPFDLKMEDFLGYSASRFNSRMEHIMRAGSQTPDELFLSV